jgi:prepilin-type N-terminal cleavage/methylation domain-containing protein
MKLINPTGSKTSRAFTLIEVMVVTALLLILVTSATASIYFMDQATRRLADQTAAMGVVEAKIYEIRAVAYNPPVYPFASTNVSTNFSASISLDKSGQTYRVPGTVTALIQPITTGHLVTVTGTFQTPGKPLVVSLQTVVNKFSGGQQ